MPISKVYYLSPRRESYYVTCALKGCVYLVSYSSQYYAMYCILFMADRVVFSIEIIIGISMERTTLLAMIIFHILTEVGHEVYPSL